MRRKQRGVSAAVDERLERVSGRKWLWALCIRSVIAVAAIYLLFGIVFGIGIAQGESMLPAIQEGDILLFYRLAPEYYMGDIVLIDTDSREDYLKRVCALPGQTVEIDDEAGAFIVDGQVAIEPYVYEETNSKVGVNYPLTLNENEYFCMGDHRENSFDSRNYGAVNKSGIEGKVIAVLRVGN